jgi:hypothetical protein
MGDTVSEELIQQLRDAVLRQLSAPADEREQVLAAVRSSSRARACAQSWASVRTWNRSTVSVSRVCR